MPITKSATKALKRDKRRTEVNKVNRTKYRSAIKEMRQKPSLTALKRVYSYLDRAVKKNLIHKNKASRLKSRLGKLIKKD
ncbi:30S ribosomal protein S20 [Candidatus Beckwithbacteria bacterium CG10_big_fil_rev_8_21_14_0_10_34_10]|uniref:Small ribosomal subunit protein bS20 n=1 Tax=Candidatus Beckwithbacteria bacterium CG10_big_fil_rev_8_21_14_0_10_34_10 TaxID=1974495 RepID=A0A2H0W9G3_9BACT|nr:MAG: 30S ribosomal protein S20 [Candidatus Beckwithbacteria bacterium CG10_big_fil_rev_8_21_14_0_10_34_10]